MQGSLQLPHYRGMQVIVMRMHNLQDYIETQVHGNLPAHPCSICTWWSDSAEGLHFSAFHFAVAHSPKFLSPSLSLPLFLPAHFTARHVHDIFAAALISALINIFLALITISLPYFRRSSSSSVSAQCSTTFRNLPILTMSGSFSPEDCENAKHYNLLALVQSTNAASSDELCYSYFEAIIKEEVVPEVVPEMTLTMRKKVAQFEKLLPLHCSTDQRPDVAVVRKSDDLPLMLVEVHSSPFTNSYCAEMHTWCDGPTSPIPSV